MGKKRLCYRLEWQHSFDDFSPTDESRVIRVPAEGDPDSAARAEARRIRRGLSSRDAKTVKIMQLRAIRVR